MAKAKAGPAAIVIGIVILAAIIYVIYHFAFAKYSRPASNPSTIPAYARAAMTDAQLKQYGLTRPTAPANAAGGAAAAHPGAPSPGH